MLCGARECWPFFGQAKQQLVTREAGLINWHAEKQGICESRYINYTPRARLPRMLLITSRRKRTHERAQRQENCTMRLVLYRESINLSRSAASAGLARTDPLDRVFYHRRVDVGATAGGPFAHKPLTRSCDYARINKMKSAHDAGSCLVPAAFRSLLVPTWAHAPFISHTACAR